MGKAVTLGAGTFAGCQQVAAGLYNVTTTPGQSGNFVVTGTNDNYDEILGAAGGSGGVPSVRVTIQSGDQIQISGMSGVTFTPVTTPFVTAHATINLGDGTWTVGQDIGPGNYVATAGAGQSGNFIVTGTDEYDEILGTAGGSGGVPNVTVTLTDGDVIQISGMSQVTMTAT
jgi:ribosomal protein S28E/S33